jgi:hypothetical protein
MSSDFDFELARESASSGFSLLHEALEVAEAQLIEFGTNLARDGKFAEVAGLVPVRNRLSQLRDGLEGLNRQFFSVLDPDGGFDDEIGEDESGHKRRTRTRGPNKSLTVTLWDGRVIRESTAAQTFSMVLGEFGWESVENLGIEVSGIPLVSRQRHTLYDSKRMVSWFYDGWYVMTNTSTPRKAQLLQDVSEALGRTIQVVADVD